MLRRKVYDQLMEWKSREHKPLVLRGPRQVGKTFILKRFAEENYAHCFYIDLERNESAKNAFNENLNVDAVMRNLSLVRPDIPLIPGKTLLIFDGIHASPRAELSLKSFAEDGRYDVVASSSFLGFTKSVLEKVLCPREDAPLTPIGQTEDLAVRPLDFEEFLWAAGIDDDAIALMKASIREKAALNGSQMESFDRLYRDYLVVGGMPEAVSAFFETGMFPKVFKVQDRIISRCRKDVVKYNTKINAEKVHGIMRSVPVQLSMDCKRFTYSRITGSGSTNENRARYFDALEWVRSAGYATLSRNVRSPVHPLESYVKPDDFKLYLADTGILIRMMGHEAALAAHEGDVSDGNGAVAENAVALGIIGNGLPLRCYRKTGGDDRMELDFVIERNRSMVAIEVKSGRSRRFPSLAKAQSVFRFDRRIKFGKTNIFVDDNGVENYPLFACAFINEIVPKGPIDFGDFPDYLM